MAVYKTKSFSKWAVNAGLHDLELRQAADEVISGLVDANLGGGIYKNALHCQGIEGSEQEVEHLLPSAEANICSICMASRRVRSPTLVKKSFVL